MNDIVENDNPDELGLVARGNNGSANIFECLAKSNYSAKELSILLQINNLNGFSEREIYRDNIGRITADLKELAEILGVQNFYHQVMHIDLRPN